MLNSVEFNTLVAVIRKKNNIIVVIRGVHSVDRVRFERVSFDSIEFWICYFSYACCGGSRSSRVGSISHSLLEDQLFELSGLHRFGVSWNLSWVSIGLGLLSINNWFGFIGYRSGLVFFQVEFGYKLLISIDRFNIRLNY